MKFFKKGKFVRATMAIEMYGLNLYILNTNNMKYIIDNYEEYIDNYPIDVFFSDFNIFNKSVIHINPVVEVGIYGSDNDQWSLNVNNYFLKIYVDFAQYLTNYTNMLDVILFNYEKVILTDIYFIQKIIFVLIVIVYTGLYFFNIN